MTPGAWSLLAYEFSPEKQKHLNEGSCTHVLNMVQQAQMQNNTKQHKSIHQPNPMQLTGARRFRTCVLPLSDCASLFLGRSYVLNIDFHGYSLDIHGYPWVVHGYPWKVLDLCRYPCIIYIYIYILQIHPWSIHRYPWIIYG